MVLTYSTSCSQFLVYGMHVCTLNFWGYVINVERFCAVVVETATIMITKLLNYKFLVRADFSIRNLSLFTSDFWIPRWHVWMSLQHCLNVCHDRFSAYYSNTWFTKYCIIWWSLRNSALDKAKVKKCCSCGRFLSYVVSQGLVAVTAMEECSINNRQVLIGWLVITY